jgi:hypothetical protein
VSVKCKPEHARIAMTQSLRPLKSPVAGAPSALTSPCASRGAFGRAFVTRRDSIGCAMALADSSDHDEAAATPCRA